MSSESAKILLTGLPGCGKTTAIMKIVAQLCRGLPARDSRAGRSRYSAARMAATRVTGFYTREIRENDVRKGFSWNRLDGTSGVLAHEGIKSRFKVGKYGVDVAGFEEAVVPILNADQTDAELFVIDEIGKMECFSQKFITAVRALFASDKSVLATVARKGGGLIAEVKSFPDAKLFNLTRENRDKTIAQIVQILSSRRQPAR